MSSGAELFRADRRTDGQTERHDKPIVAVRNFAKAPKNYTIFIPMYFDCRSLSSGSNLIDFHTYKLYMN
jgi:hypothetical protein